MKHECVLHHPKIKKQIQIAAYNIPFSQTPNVLDIQGILIIFLRCRKMSSKTTKNKYQHDLWY